ncbi:uncharacterized protein LOC143219138 isoform X2 [Lasioglossum baleicum]|uniref:uncharacterized protein LOC143219138 isoform X2 n=1 Tax=Lasioglossum baleicum TaxID=434251 RepID=UPI003FCEB786
MSFAKAKIQRFNDVENDVPPPGAYDPKFNSTTKGVTLDKSDRFNDAKSTSTTDCSLSVCNRSTTQPSITFRTPQPAQKAVPKRSTKVKSRSILPATDTKLKYTSENQLIDLQVECANKTKTIEEHAKHIQEMQEERQKLQSQLEDLQKNQAETMERHRKEIETMIQLQQEVLKMHTEKHQLEVELLRKQVLETCEAKTHEIRTVKDLESDLRSQISDLKKKINTLESELTNQKQISEDKLLKLEVKNSAQEIEISRLETMNGELDLQLKESKAAINSLTKVNKLLEAEMAKHKDTLAELLKLEEKSSAQATEISRLETMNGELDLQLKESKAAINSLTEVNKLLEAETAKHKDALAELLKLEEKSSAQATEISRLETMNGELDLQLKESKVAINSLTEVNKLLEAETAKNKDALAEKLLKLEGKSSAQEIEISRLETMNGELDLQLKESKVAINSLTEVNELLEAETAKYEDTLAEANARIEELSNTLLERDDNVEDKTELLEEEIARRKAAEEEVQKLLEYNARLKKDHDEISEQYAELIGHQNHKQRIKHVSQLKDKINQLEKDLRVKTTKIEQQQKIIEKIKSEERRVPNKLG